MAKLVFKQHEKTCSLILLQKMSAQWNIAELASQLHPLWTGDRSGGLETGQVARTVYMASLPIPNSHKAKGRPIKNVSLEQELQPQSKHIIPYY